jgi:hypothetical protein
MNDRKAIVTFVVVYGTVSLDRTFNSFQVAHFHELVSMVVDVSSIIVKLFFELMAQVTIP